MAIKYQFTHTADATARIVLQNALFPGPNKKVSDLVVPWTTYTDPEVAHVGMYDHDAEEQGIEVETFTQSIGEIDRGKADGELDGFVKVHVKKGSDQILGATIVASHAGEMINELTLAITAGIGLKTLATVIHPYPTQAEAIKKVADAYNRTRLTPTVQRPVQALVGLDETRKLIRVTRRVRPVWCSHRRHVLQDIPDPEKMDGFFCAQI